MGLPHVLIATIERFKSVLTSRRKGGTSGLLTISGKEDKNTSSVLTMLALPTFGMNDFPYASLLERSSSSSQKSFNQQQGFQAIQLNTSVADVGGQIEWKPEHFPHKMYDLLEDVERKGLDDIVSWLPDGKSFKIHSQIGFEQSIMPLYFSGMSSYKSFRRQLNLYGIYQHRHRPNQDANGK